MRYAQMLTFVLVVTVLVVAVGFVIQGCDKAAPQAGAQMATVVSGLYVATPVPEDAPDFKRTYETKLNSGHVVELSFTTSPYLGRHAESIAIVTQPDGKHVFVSVDDVADHIIIPGLVTPIEDVIKEFKRLDEFFWSNTPQKFTDKNGDTWVRQAKP